MSALQLVGLAILLGVAGTMVVVALSLVGAMLWEDIKAGRYDSLGWVGMTIGAAAIIAIGALLWRYG